MVLVNFTAHEYKIAALKAAMESANQSAEDAGKWVQLIRQYSEITELDAPLRWEDRSLNFIPEYILK